MTTSDGFEAPLITTPLALVDKLRNSSSSSSHPARRLDSTFGSEMQGYAETCSPLDNVDDSGSKFLQKSAEKHFVKKNDNGALTYIAHADYYIMLRACARVVRLISG